MPPPPASHKFVSLEIGRYIGTLMVVIEHYSTTCAGFGLGKPMFATPGPAVLTFFFSLSGFVIYTVHHRDAGQQRRVARYFWRRVWRIYPVYWLSLTLMIAVLWHGITWPYLFNNLTLTPTAGNIAELNPPAWSLRYEMLYYTLLGLALLLPYVGRLILPAWAVLLACAWYRDWRGHGTMMQLWPFFPQGLGQHFFALLNIFILTGVAAAWVFARVQPRQRLLWAMLGLSAAALLLLERADGWGTLYPVDIRLPFTATAMAMLIFTLAALERGGHLRLHPRWEACGVMSYPLYLLHSDVAFAFAAYFFYHPAARHDFTAPALFAVMLGLAVCAAWAVAYWFDVPVQRALRRVM